MVWVKDRRLAAFVASAGPVVLGISVGDTGVGISEEPKKTVAEWPFLTVRAIHRYMVLGPKPRLAWYARRISSRSGGPDFKSNVTPSRCG